MNSLTIALNMLHRSLLQRKGFLKYVIIPAAVVSLLIGVLGKQGDNRVMISYLNLDQGTLGSQVEQELRALPDYDLEAAESAEDLKNDLIKKKVDAGFIIPAGFSEMLLAGSSPQLAMYQMSQDEATITLKMKLDSILSGYQGTIALYRNQGLLAADLRQATEQTIAQIQKHQIKAEITDLKLHTNPNMNIVIGFMLIFMMGLINNTASLVLEDRRLRTLARTYTAPVRSSEIVLGNFLGSLSVGTLQVLIILMLTRYVVGYEYGLPFTSLFVILEFFLLASMGIASAIASLVRNTTNMNMINSLVITPTCMLGGCFWPISLMPEWMQKLSNFVPQTWALGAIERMSLGQSLSHMWMNMGVLTLFALILMSVGSAILKPAEAEIS